MTNDGNPNAIIETTLGDLDVARARVESFIRDIVEAFEAGDLPEEQFLYMKDRVEKFLAKISLYEDVFINIKDAYTAVK